MVAWRLRTTAGIRQLVRKLKAWCYYRKGCCEVTRRMYVLRLQNLRRNVWVTQERYLAGSQTLGRPISHRKKSRPTPQDPEEADCDLSGSRDPC